MVTSSRFTVVLINCLYKILLQFIDFLSALDIHGLELNLSSLWEGFFNGKSLLTISEHLGKNTSNS